jgi:hypothetical protein
MTHNSLEKMYWMIGEVALDIIKHVRVDKKDIEIMKRLILQQKQNKFKSEEEIEKIEKMIEIFETTNEEREKYDNIEIKNIGLTQKVEEDKTVFIQNAENNNTNLTKIEITTEHVNALLDTVNVTNQQTTEYRRNEGNILTVDEASKESQIQATFDKEKIPFEEASEETKLSEKTIKKLDTLISFMKKLFSHTLTGSDSDLIDQNPEEILETEDEAFQNIKELVNNSLQNMEEKKNTVSKKLGINKSNSLISTASVDILNYKVRSLLNLPNSILEQSYMKYVEKNPSIIKNMNKEINFTRFEEGFPHKFSDVEDNTVSTQIENYESLSSILLIFSLLDSSFEELSNSHSFENFVSNQALEISYLDSLIDEWNKYKEYISGRRKNDNFEEIYFLQNTIIDNHQTLIYALKSLTSTLSNNISRIPPTILVKLPINIISKINFDKTDFKFLEYNTNVKNIEMMALNDLNMSLLRMVHFNNRS